MSRAAWAGLFFVGGGLGLVLFLMTRPLPANVRGDAERVISELKKAETHITADRASLDKLVAQDSDYMKDQPEVAAARAAFDTQSKGLSAAKAKASGLSALLEKDRHGDQAEVFALVVATRQLKVANLGIGRTALDRARLVLSYKTDHKMILSEARTRANQARALKADAALTNRVTLAKTAYPEVAAKLDKRLGLIVGGATLLDEQAQKMETKAAATPIDYAGVGRLASEVTQGSARLSVAQRELMKGVAGLSLSVDKILIDMKEGAGKYYHKYKLVEGGVARTLDWEAVDAATYAKHRKHLGMAISSKPEGTLPEDATTIASPPGYNYVGNRRYGRWEQRNGGNFWVFYGRYALMRDVLWGRGYYSPMRRSAWGNYNTSRRAGRAYYGKNRQYGTTGSRTRKRYASTGYYKRSATRAARSSSGGGYSGSRYKGRSGSGGSRSGGYKSSRFRGSSRGGSGK